MDKVSRTESQWLSTSRLWKTNDAAQRTAVPARRLSAQVALAFGLALSGCHPAISLGGDDASSGGNSVGTGGKTYGDPSTTGGTDSATAGRTSGAGGSKPTTTGGTAGAFGSTTTGTQPIVGGATGTGGTTTTTTGSSSGGSASNTSCFQLTEQQCKATESCNAVPRAPRAGETCSPDARGFSSCVSGGCRLAATFCNSLKDLDLICSSVCQSQHWSIDPNSGCPRCVCSDTIQIPAAFKGWEIVPWLESDGWHYSLVQGTNSIKSCDRVKLHESEVVDGVVYSLALPHLLAVKTALARLNVTGDVTLCNGGCPDIDCPLDTLPPDTLDDLKLYAEAIGLNLGVAQRF